MPDQPTRHYPVHQPLVQRRNQAAIVFVTVCVARRRPLLARPDAVAVLRDAWMTADHWVVGRYVVMPDHVHLFCAPAREDALELRRWVRFWKSHASRHWPGPSEHPLWETDFWDVQLRSAHDYDAKWLYVQDNPVRHGLVGQADQWPYAGEIACLEW